MSSSHTAELAECKPKVGPVVVKLVPKAKAKQKAKVQVQSVAKAKPMKRKGKQLLVCKAKAIQKQKATAKIPTLSEPTAATAKRCSRGPPRPPLIPQPLRAPPPIRASRPLLLPPIGACIRLEPKWVFEQLLVRKAKTTQKQRAKAKTPTLSEPPAAAAERCAGRPPRPLPIGASRPPRAPPISRTSIVPSMPARSVVKLPASRPLFLPCGSRERHPSRARRCPFAHVGSARSFVKLMT